MYSRIPVIIKKHSTVLVVLGSIAIASITNLYVYDKRVISQNPVIYQNIDISIASTSPSGLPVTLSIDMLDATFDMNECRNSGYVSDIYVSGITILCAWGSDTDISFALEDSGKSKQYRAHIDFADTKYKEGDFIYYQSVMPNFLYSLQEKK